MWRGKPRTSSIWKRPVEGRVEIRSNNLQGDVQADLRVHGGPRKALYAYAWEDSLWWKQELGCEIEAGAWGENLTLKGVPIGESKPGDRWQVGSAILEITQPRVPCWKLGAKMQDPRFPRKFARSERTGAYLAVVEEGNVGAGDEVLLLSRSEHPITIGLVAHLNHTDAELAAMYLQATQMDLGAEEWRRLFPGP